MLAVYPPSAAHHEPTPHGGAVWLDLVSPSEAEARLIEDHTGLTLPSEAELSEIEPSARLSFTGGLLRLSVPIIAKADTDHPSLSHVGLVLTPKLLISVRREPLRVFQAVAKTVSEAGEAATSVEVFVSLMEAYAGRQADLLESARGRLDQISHRAFRPAPTDRRRIKRSNVLMRERLQLLGRIAERTSIIREGLLGVDRAILFTLETAKAWFSPELTSRLKTVRDDIASLSQFEEHLLAKVQFLLDAVLGFISIEQNDIFKVLTIASVVGIFPTLMAGWYGMNFQHMPEYAWRYGYQYGITVIVGSAIVPLLWFKWRGWL